MAIKRGNGSFAFCAGAVTGTASVFLLAAERALITVIFEGASSWVIPAELATRLTRSASAIDVSSVSIVTPTVVFSRTPDRSGAVLLWNYTATLLLRCCWNMYLNLPVCLSGPYNGVYLH